MSIAPPRTSASPISARSTVVWFALWATVALGLDLITKQWAVATLSNGGMVLTDRFALMLLFNTGAAGGISLGQFTWLINVVGTAATVALVMTVLLPLARVDQRAMLAMGLIAGGASGNLASLIVEPRGVPDFLALRLSESMIVFNVADIALWVGAALLVPITMGLVRAVRAQRRVPAAVSTH